MLDHVGSSNDFGSNLSKSEGETASCKVLWWFQRKGTERDLGDFWEWGCLILVESMELKTIWKVCAQPI